MSPRRADNPKRPGNQIGLGARIALTGGSCLAVFTSIYVLVFGLIALRGQNYEFLLYVGVILVVGAWILWKQPKVGLPKGLLWGLSLWGFLHMSGGLIRFDDDVLYGLVLLPLNESGELIRYDQLVHAFGFGTATVVCYHLLQPHLRVDDRFRRATSLWILIIMMGCGVGAINEIIEFIAVLTMPQTGVGGYTNTLWDLVFNLIGATVAVVLLARSSRPARRSFH